MKLFTLLFFTAMLFILISASNISAVTEDFNGEKPVVGEYIDITDPSTTTLTTVSTTTTDTIPFGPFDVKIIDTLNIPIQGQQVWLFTTSRSYTGDSCVTDNTGICTIDPTSPGIFQLSLIVNGVRYWSADFNVPSSPVIEMEIVNSLDFDASFIDGTPVVGERAYLYDGNTVYQDVSCLTDVAGSCIVAPVTTGSHKIRLRAIGNWFWSNDFDIPINSVSMSIPNPVSFSASYTDGSPVVGERAQLFDGNDVYQTSKCDTDGSGSCVLAPVKVGNHRIRMYVNGNLHWSNVFSVPTNSVSMTIT